MFKNVLPCAVLTCSSCLQPCFSVLKQQIRNTFILKRRYPIILSKIGANRPRKLRSRHYVYDLVENTENKKQQPLSLILTTYVSGLGDKGDLISVRPHYARQHLLPSGQAVYASPENIEEYAKLKKESSEKPMYSSPTALRMINFLSKRIINLTMNAENPWTVELWHIRVSFRKSGIIVPECALELPNEPISGPDPNKEGKEFAVHVMINKTERVPVRFKVRHCDGQPETAFPTNSDWFLEEGEPILEGQVELLSSIPRPSPRRQKCVS